MAIEFGTAKVRARAVGYLLDESRVRESETWWFFPARQIGSFGILVDKRDGTVFPFGSTQGKLEDWLWAYDQGLREGSRFVIPAVHDVLQTIEALITLQVVNDRWWTRRDLESLPVAYPAHPTLSFEKLRQLRPAPFEWQFAAA